LRSLIATLDTPIEKDGNTEVIYMRYAMAKDLVETLTGVGSLKDEKADKPKTKATTDKVFDIRADEATNALIITAPQDLMRTLKSVISQLAVRRAQVHIEAIIAEISYDKGKEIGVEWQTKQISDGVIAASRLPTQTIFSDVSTAGAIASKIGQIGQGLSVGYFVGGELRTLLSAFANDSNINVLSTPSLISRLCGTGNHQRIR
jgi:general secretion pathway protein D